MNRSILSLARAVTFSLAVCGLSPAAFAQKIYVANSAFGGDVGLIQVDGGGTMTSVSGTSLAIATGMARDASGNLFVCESINGGISKFEPANSWTKSFPVGGVSKGYALAFDAAGNLYATSKDANTQFPANCVVKFTAAGGVGATFATGFNDPRGLAFDSAGNLYVANYGDNTIGKVTPAGAVSTFATGMNQPWGLAVDASGNLFVANYVGKTISKITPAGAVSTFATLGPRPYDVDFDTSGNLYCAITNAVYRFKPDGTQSNFASGVGSQFVSLVVEPGFSPLDPIDTWRTEQFGANASNPAISGDTADPDNDGVSNLLEYAFGSNPVGGSPTPLPKASMVNGQLALTYQQKSGPEDITMEIETATTLPGWAVTTTYDFLDASYDAVTAVVTYKIGFPVGTVSQYARVKVTRK